MPLQQLTGPAYLAQFDTTVHDKIKRAAKEQYPDATHAVCFENQQLDSSQLGQRSSLLIGPSNTYKTLEEVEGRWLNDLPSQRQYPTTFCLAEELRK